MKTVTTVERHTWDGQKWVPVSKTITTVEQRAQQYTITNGTTSATETINRQLERQRVLGI